MLRDEESLCSLDAMTIGQLKIGQLKVIEYQIIIQIEFLDLSQLIYQNITTINILIFISKLPNPAYLNRRDASRYRDLEAF